jgi:hypothetical protein
MIKRRQVDSWHLADRLHELSNSLPSARTHAVNLLSSILFILIYRVAVERYKRQSLFSSMVIVCR